MPVGKCGDADGGVRRVDALAAMAAGAEHVHPDVVWVNLDVNILCLRQHSHRSRRGVDSSAALRLRHPLPGGCRFRISAGKRPLAGNV